MLHREMPRSGKPEHFWAGWTYSHVNFTIPAPFPFGMSERAYRLAWQAIPTRDPEAEVEAAQWLALDLIDDLGAPYEGAAIQLEVLTSELVRRRQLLKRHRDHPFAPRRPQRTVNLQARIDAVKDAWSVERACTDHWGLPAITPRRGRAARPSHPADRGRAV